MKEENLVIKLSDAGFSLLELMVSMAILAIMTSIAVPNFISWVSKQKLVVSAENVNAAVLRARTAAIRENSPVVVRFDSDNNSYCCFLDDGSGGGTRGNDIQDGSEETITEGSTESGVNISRVEFGTANPKRSYMVFNSQGFLNDSVGSGSLDLINRKGMHTSVEVNMGGMTSVAPLTM